MRAALREYERAVEADAGDAYALFCRGRCRKQLGDAERAAQDLRQVPGPPTPPRRLGQPPGPARACHFHGPVIPMGLPPPPGPATQRACPTGPGQPALRQGCLREVRRAVRAHGCQRVAIRACRQHVPRRVREVRCSLPRCAFEMRAGCRARWGADGSLRQNTAVLYGGAEAVLSICPTSRAGSMARLSARRDPCAPISASSPRHAMRRTGVTPGPGPRPLSPGRPMRPRARGGWLLAAARRAPGRCCGRRLLGCAVGPAGQPRPRA